MAVVLRYDMGVFCFRCRTKRYKNLADHQSVRRPPDLDPATNQRGGFWMTRGWIPVRLAVIGALHLLSDNPDLQLRLLSLSVSIEGRTTELFPGVWVVVVTPNAQLASCNTLELDPPELCKLHSRLLVIRRGTATTLNRHPFR